jgi:hypothetical protein
MAQACILEKAYENIVTNSSSSESDLCSASEDGSDSDIFSIA